MGLRMLLCVTILFSELTLGSGMPLSSRLAQASTHQPSLKSTQCWTGCDTPVTHSLSFEMMRPTPSRAPLDRTSRSPLTAPASDGRQPLACSTPTTGVMRGMDISMSPIAESHCRRG